MIMGGWSKGLGQYYRHLPGITSFEGTERALSICEKRLAVPWFARSSLIHASANTFESRGACGYSDRAPFAYSLRKQVLR